MGWAARTRLLRPGHEQVHSPGARAVSSLRGTAEALGADVAALVAEMEAAIREATAFIDAMGKG